MEIKTSSLLAVGQGFSPNMAKDNDNEIRKSADVAPASIDDSSEIVDRVEISPDVRIAAEQTSEIQSSEIRDIQLATESVTEERPKTESPEVVSQLELASVNAEAILYANSVKSADIATKVLGNSADITV